MANKIKKSGVVKFFNKDKGYGFIIDEDNGEEYFFHVTKLKQEVKKDDKVEFEVEEGKRGLQAVGIKLI